MAADERGWTTRQVELFDETEKLFLKEGFRHLTIADLAEHLHCSRRTLYTLAPSREELILAVVDRLLCRVDEAARELANGEMEPGTAISTYLGTGVSGLRGAESAFLEDLASYIPTKNLYDRHLHVSLGTMSKIIERGIDEGSFEQYAPALIAELLDAVVERVRRPEVLARAGVSIDQAFEELGRLVRKGLNRHEITS